MRYRLDPFCEVSTFPDNRLRISLRANLGTALEAIEHFEQVAVLFLPGDAEQIKVMAF